MRDRDAVREAGRTARILEVADLVGAGPWQVCGRRLHFGQAFPIARLDAELLDGGDGIFGQLGREEEQLRVAAGQHDDQLVDVGVASSEAGREWQRDRPQTGIDRAEEAGREFGAGLGNERESVALLEPMAMKRPAWARASVRSSE